MQAYKLKLNEGHTAESYQVTKDGYLADLYHGGQATIYNQSAAKAKAIEFSGTPEKFGKNYITSRVKMIQFDQYKLNPLTVKLTEEKAEYHSKSGDMFICYGRVFDEILEEGNVPAEIVDELKALSVFCVEVDYVHFL